MAQESNQVNRVSAADAEPFGSASSSATTTEIREHIEQTRAEMSQTIDAIHERLSPGRFVSDATESVKTGASQTVKRAVDAVRANPMPFAMVGAAAIALIARAAMRGQRSDLTRGQRSPGRPARTSERRGRLVAGLCGAGVAGLSAWRVSSARNTTRFQRPESPRNSPSAMETEPTASETVRLNE